MQVYKLLLSVTHTKLVNAELERRFESLKSYADADVNH